VASSSNPSLHLLLRNKKAIIAFGAHVRQLRKARNMSMEALSHEVDVELSQIYRIETGKINPTLSTLVALAKALNIPLCDLMRFDF
jgi:transcriptional regulator with XRE-family HTH domain